MRACVLAADELGIAIEEKGICAMNLSLLDYIDPSKNAHEKRDNSFCLWGTKGSEESVCGLEKEKENVFCRVEGSGSIVVETS